MTEYSYDKVWDHTAINSNDFHVQGHRNPPKPYPDETWRAKQVALGAFALTPRLADPIPKADPVRVESSHLARLSPELRDKLKVQDGLFYQGANPGNPQIGDVRIAFKVVRPQTVSVIAKQVDSTFEPYQPRSATHQIELLKGGTVSAEEMFRQEEQSNAILTWVLRLVGFIIMAVGIFLVFNLLATMADVIPFLGNLLSAGLALFALVTALALSLVTIAIGWLFYRPLLGGGLLAAALLLIGGLFYLGTKRRAAVADTRPRG